MLNMYILMIPHLVFQFRDPIIFYLSLLFSEINI
jgi:hypothetical protein